MCIYEHKCILLSDVLQALSCLYHVAFFTSKLANQLHYLLIPMASTSSFSQLSLLPFYLPGAYSSPHSVCVGPLPRKDQIVILHRYLLNLC